MTKVSRNYSEIISELANIRDRHPDLKVKAMAEGIAWGFSTARTNLTLESRLDHAPSIKAIVEELAAAWDGNDWLSGSLHVAQRHYQDILE